MIKFKLKRILDKRDIIPAVFARMAKMRPNTVTAYCNGKVKRINTKDLNHMCRALDCQITDIIEYVPEKRYQQKDNGDHREA